MLEKKKWFGWVCFELVYLHISYFKGDLKANGGNVHYTQLLC